NLPVGVTSRSSSITCLSSSVLSSTTTSAERWSLPFHTENHTSSPALLYSSCTTRLGPSPRLAHSAIGSTLYGASRSFMSDTATDWLIAGFGLSSVSTYRLLDSGWVLMNSEPPPCPFSTRTTFQALSGWPSGSVPISETVSSPRWLVAQTGP